MPTDLVTRLLQDEDLEILMTAALRAADLLEGEYARATGTGYARPTPPEDAAGLGHRAWRTRAARQARGADPATGGLPPWRRALSQDENRAIEIFRKRATATSLYKPLKAFGDGGALGREAEFLRDVESIRKRLATRLERAAWAGAEPAPGESDIAVGRGADASTTSGWTDFRFYEPGPERCLLTRLSALAGRVGREERNYWLEMKVLRCVRDAEDLAASWLAVAVEPVKVSLRSMAQGTPYALALAEHEGMIRTLVAHLWVMGIAVLPGPAFLRAAARRAGVPSPILGTRVVDRRRRHAWFWGWR